MWSIITTKKNGKKNGNMSNNNQISSSIKNKDIVNEPTTCVYDG